MDELPRLQPVNSRREYGHRRLRTNVRAVLEVVVLSLLLRLQVQPRESSQVLLAYGLVNGGPAADALPIIISSVRPPVSLRLHVTQYHVLNGRWQSRHLPWYVGLPAAPRLS